MFFPSLSKIPNMMCLNNYILHLSKDFVKTNESILEKLAVFKIECWLMADNHAGFYFETNIHLYLEILFFIDFG